MWLKGLVILKHEAVEGGDDMRTWLVNPDGRCVDAISAQDRANKQCTSVVFHFPPAPSV